MQNSQVVKEKKIEAAIESKEKEDSVNPVKRVDPENVSQNLSCVNHLSTKFELFIWKVTKKASEDEYKPENFLEQIKATYSSGAPIPEWKRLILAKKAAEKAKKEAKQKEALIPDWKKQLIKKKDNCLPNLRPVKVYVHHYYKYK